MPGEGSSSGSGAASKAAAAGFDTSGACQSCAHVGAGAVVVAPDGCVLVKRLEDLERELAAERQARVRLQHELKNAADGRPFNPEVR
jgi:ornithine carbamoyltransferase